jgi:hypothetical protein
MALDGRMTLVSNAGSVAFTFSFPERLKAEA